MLLWITSSLLFLFSLRLLSQDATIFATAFGFKRECAKLIEVSATLQELQETLETGLLPSQDRWLRLQQLDAPWGRLAYESLSELRKQGGSLLPTLRRLRALSEEHLATLKESRSKASQALAQSVVCAVLAPIFGFTLYLLLPGIEEQKWVWLAGCAVAVLVSAAGALWMMEIAENARWGGLHRRQRPWILASQCAGERLLALVRSGTPADLAWVQACTLLGSEAPELASEWGSSVWQASSSTESSSHHTGTAAAAIIASGDSIRKAIHVSLMEGRPCTERVEASLLSLRQDMANHVSREVALLATRALKPLFFCVAPAMFGLLVLGLFLTWENSAQGFGLT